MSAGAPAVSPKVELRSVSLRYFGPVQETEALADISLTIAAGEFVAVIGQSGCGKSTLLSLISGILTATSGTILIDGLAVKGPSRKVGYMLQQDYLFEWRTVLQNTVLGAEIQGADMTQARARARALLVAQVYKMNIVMTAIAILAILSSLLYLAIARLDAAVMRRR